MTLKLWRKVATGLLCLVFSPIFNSVHGQETSDLSLQMNFDKNKVIAAADTIKITAEEFFLSYEYGPAFIKKSNDPEKKHLDYMIDEKLLALDGYSRNLDTSEEIVSLITDFKNDLATEELFRDSILSRVKITDDEIKTTINKKQISVQIKWLFSEEEPGIKNIYRELRSGKSFDTLFAAQINDTVSRDDRMLQTDLYNLDKKNPVLARIIDTLKIGDVSLPIHTEDGWYIIRITDLQKNQLASQSEYERLRQESVNALTKQKMDSLSDIFVNNLMTRNDPIIKRDVFKILRSYIGKYYLAPEKFREWQLGETLNEKLSAVKTDINDLVLVELTNGNVLLGEFIKWYRNRSTYIKLNDNSFASYSTALENLIWKMVRDKLLSGLAAKYGYNEYPSVKKQMNWWRDKIVSSAVRNEIVNSIRLENPEVNTKANNDKGSMELQAEFNKKMLHKLLALKQEYKININENALKSIPVDEPDPTAIELYFMKNGGLIPRTPYPTINHEWVNWE